MTDNKILNIDQVLNRRDEFCVLDVRTPAEYKKGHILGAISFPLFSDEERAKIGTSYKQESKATAFKMGLTFVEGKLSKFVAEAEKVAGDKSILCYCWRGGQRSGSMHWLLQGALLPTYKLQDGYKAYRSKMLENICSDKLKLVVLGGKTGCGKTEILKELNRAGEQIINLEQMANHKGSSFGAIMEATQPSTEQFENQLGELISKLDLRKRIWIENESKQLGTIYLQQGLWTTMKSSPLINLNLPKPERLIHLEKIYGNAEKSDLIHGFQRLKKRLGGKAVVDAIELVNDGDLQAAADIALSYYDKTYQYNLDKNLSPNILNLDLEKLEPTKNAKELILFANKMKL